MYLMTEVEIANHFSPKWVVRIRLKVPLQLDYGP